MRVLYHLHSLASIPYLRSRKPNFILSLHLSADLAWSLQLSRKAGLLLVLGPEDNIPFAFTKSWGQAYCWPHQSFEFQACCQKSSLKIGLICALKWNRVNPTWELLSSFLNSCLTQASKAASCHLWSMSQWPTITGSSLMMISPKTRSLVAKTPNPCNGEALKAGRTSDTDQASLS